jgi:hypothetical protein
MSDHGPIEAEAYTYMNAVAQVIAGTLPKGFGFTLLVFRPGTHDGRMNYISSADRGDMLVALKELVVNMEGRGHAPPEHKQ